MNRVVNRNASLRVLRRGACAFAGAIVLESSWTKAGSGAKMPANLTPEYMDAEKAYKRAGTPPERLECLERMLRIACMNPCFRVFLSGFRKIDITGLVCLALSCSFAKHFHSY